MTTFKIARYETVGSFLRPAQLKEARAKYAAGQIDKAALKQVEDQAIIDLLAKQAEVGLKFVTDGEFRRSWWHLDFFWGFQGVEKRQDGGYQFSQEYTRAETASLTGPISGDNHPFVEDFKFVAQHAPAGTIPKQTFPAPAQFLAELYRPENIKQTQKIYPRQEDLLADIARAYQQVIKDLYEAGARVIQVDDCTWGSLASDSVEGISIKEDQKASQDAKERAAIREGLKALYLQANNEAIAQAPKDLVINTHVCRGNYHSDWATKGPYNEVATPLFDQANYYAYYLEYDTERAGGFDPLVKVSDDKVVVLGLITSKEGQLEDKEAIKARIKEASQYIPLERLALSPQCGFASTEEGNILAEKEQWAKLKLVKEIAQEVWQDA